MSRILALFLMGALLLSGCGQVFVGFVSNPQVPSSSITGLVIVVHLGSTTDINGGTVTFTAVTFSNGGLSNTVNFCGDKQAQFRLNESVRADFNPGTVCSTLVAVVVL
ncbi:MAG TPA: hypothetical protein VLT16_14410 [Candidatus Limnocylindrales bacterium]|nr:hypothetical protein [Candidatus Limnocylindrales bacterium]